MGFGDVFRAAIRDEWDGLGRITSDLRAADIATILNALLGLAAVVLGARGETVLAIELVLLGVIVDGVDGFLARLGFGGGPLGPTLDTLADVITFAVAPAVIVLQAVQAPWPGHALVMGFFLVCVLLRLARFESIRNELPRGYFSGLSSPGGALAVLAFLLAGFDGRWLLGAAAFAGILMVSRIRYPKLRGGLGGVAVLVILGVLLSSGRAVQETANLVMLAFMAVYVLAGPFYVLYRMGPTTAPEET